MKLGCLVVAAVLLSACAYKNPTQPTTPADQPTAGVPARIELGAVPGVGEQGGTGTISARVFDAFTAALPNQTVAFSASGGELGESSAVTDEKGVARTTITGPAGAAITIIAAVGTLEQKAQIAMQAKPDAPPPLTPPQFPPPTPPPPPPPPHRPGAELHGDVISVARADRRQRHRHADGDSDRVERGAGPHELRLGL